MPDDIMEPSEARASRRAQPAAKRYRALRRMICRGTKFESGDELPPWVLDASPNLLKRLGEDIEEVK